MFKTFCRGFCPAGCLLLMVVVTACTPGFKRSPDTVSVDEQVRYAEALQPALLQRLGGLCADPALQAAVDQAVARLGIDTQAVVIANDDMPHLLALTDGTLLVTRGALFDLKDADALAALLAHAYGHILQGHPLQSLMRITAGGPPPVDSPVASWAATTSAALLALEYSGEDEQAADVEALNLLAASGIQPTVLLRHLQDGVPLPRHPFSGSRLAAAQKLAAGLSVAPAAEYDATVFASAYDTLATLHPAYVDYRRARRAEKSGEIDKALTLYLQAAEKAPEESLLLTGLGMAYLRQDVLVSARQHLTRAARVDSQYYYSQLGLGYISLLQQDNGRALRHLQRSLKLLTTPRAGFLLAEAYIALGDEVAARDYYRAVAEAGVEGLSKTAKDRLKALEVKP